MITIKNNIDGDEYRGVTVMYDDGPLGECPGGKGATVTVDCNYPPLAIELLKHAIVAMESREVTTRNSC